VANNHQGWVDVESREGEGSTFSLVFPLQTERVQ
jgi:signal transduction histidine kinase